jgi:hypothetical protein
MSSHKSHGSSRDDNASIALATVTGSFNPSAPKRNTSFGKDLDQFAIHRSHPGGLLQSIPGNGVFASSGSLNGGSSHGGSTIGGGSGSSSYTGGRYSGGPGPIAPPGSRPSSDKKLPKSYSFIYTMEQLEGVDSEPEPPPPPPCWQRFWIIVCKIYEAYEIVFLIVLAIMLARLYYPPGAEWLEPDITSTWIAVMLIFRKYFWFFVCLLLLLLLFLNGGLTPSVSGGFWHFTPLMTLSTKSFIIFFFFFVSSPVWNGIENG